ncbi:acyltransferase [Clostridium algoriphilum]|uniref:acyltransferase n=1 Tax=Clostridium algoriphilum TaxID=198347 RepID=UPI001CF40644|nr:acyltransferase [Clostridium algoriphilum]MCB2293947.1 acyltransferase [Clostridium algoriphilum]
MSTIDEIIVKTKQKDNYFEIIRAICIICVMLIHCQNGIEYEDSPLFSFNYDYWLIFRQFVNFPVAVFVFLTAYFTNITKVEQKPLKYYGSRVRRLVIPFLVWSILYSIINIAKGGFNVDVTKIIFNIVTGQASTPLYYIVVLIQLVIITPLLIKCLRNKYLNLVALCITPTFLIIMYAYTYITKDQIPFYATVFPGWFLFYYIGLHVKLNGFKSRKKDGAGSKNVSKALIIMGCALLFSIIECYGMLYLKFPVGFASSQVKISSFLYSFSLINLIFAVKGNKIITKVNFVTRIGNYSYGIFYVHCFWILIVSKGMSYIPSIHNILPVYQLIELSAILVLSMLSIIVTNKIIGNKLASKYLGF